MTFYDMPTVSKILKFSPRFERRYGAHFWPTEHDYHEISLYFWKHCIFIFFESQKCGLVSIYWMIIWRIDSAKWLFDCQISNEYQKWSFLVPEYTSFGIQLRKLWISDSHRDCVYNGENNHDQAKEPQSKLFIKSFQVPSPIISR